MSFQRRIHTIITLIVLAGSLNAEVKTCTQCTSDYVGSPSATETCTALKTYLTCLETASGDGCPLDPEKADKIGSDAEGCTLGSLCTCQKDYWKTALTTDTAKCDAAIARATCLKGTTGTEPAEGTGTGTDEACADDSTITTLGTTTVTKLKELSTCKPAPTCACEVTHFTSDESDKCTVNKNFISCLVGKTEVGCSPESVVKDLAASAESDMGASCSKSAVCICEIDYTKADQSTEAKKCTSANEFLSCLDEINTADDKGCNGTVTAASLKSYVESNIQTVFCSAAGFQAEVSFTIVCLLLTVSAIFST